MRYFSVVRDFDTLSIKDINGALESAREEDRSIRPLFLPKSFMVTVVSWQNVRELAEHLDGQLRTELDTALEPGKNRGLHVGVDDVTDYPIGYMGFGSNRAALGQASDEGFGPAKIRKLGASCTPQTELVPTSVTDIFDANNLANPGINHFSLDFAWTTQDRNGLPALEETGATLLKHLSRVAVWLEPARVNS